MKLWEIPGWDKGVKVRREAWKTGCYSRFDAGGWIGEDGGGASVNYGLVCDDWGLFEEAKAQPEKPPLKSFPTEEISKILNCHSMENVSDTPDFILADFLDDCFQAFSKAVVRREEWYGRKK